MLLGEPLTHAVNRVQCTRHMSLVTAREGRAMTDNPRLQQLLDELLDSQSTPEDVCRSDPELLPEVRAYWREVRRVRSQLDSLFPAPPGPDAGAPPPLPEETALPRIPFYEV